MFHILSPKSVALALSCKLEVALSLIMNNMKSVFGFCLAYTAKHETVLNVITLELLL